jgi:hypothetical protein
MFYALIRGIPVGTSKNVCECSQLLTKKERNKWEKELKGVRRIP